MTNTEKASDLRLGKMTPEEVGGGIEGMTTWCGSGEDLDVTPIAKVATDITDYAKEWAKESVAWYCESCNKTVAPDARDRCPLCGGTALEKQGLDQVEGTCAVDLHKALKSVPWEILDDQGFWRYLAVRHFWEFIRLREEVPFKNGKHRGEEMLVVMKYVDAKAQYESVLTRMFLRVKALGGDEHYRMASKIDKAGDFWRSHVVRVRNGSIPAITRALVGQQISDRLITDPVREAVKQVTRHWANIVPNVYNDTQASDIVDSVWKNVEEKIASGYFRKVAAEKKDREKARKNEQELALLQKGGLTPDGP